MFIWLKRWTGVEFATLSFKQFVGMFKSQVLITEKSLEAFNSLDKILPHLRRLASSKLSNQEAEKLVSLLDQLILWVLTERLAICMFVLNTAKIVLHENSFHYWLDLLFFHIFIPLYIFPQVNDVEVHGLQWHYCLNIGFLLCCKLQST